MPQALLLRSGKNREQQKNAEIDAGASARQQLNYFADDGEEPSLPTQSHPNSVRHQGVSLRRLDETTGIADWYRSVPVHLR